MHYLRESVHFFIQAKKKKLSTRVFVDSGQNLEHVLIHSLILTF